MKKIFSLEFFLKKRGPEIKGHRGSVTVFLSAIMVPMMLLMLTFFDLAKYEAAKPIVSEAGNMALNAGLTEFNVSLKDFYGLFAISKSEEELGENLEKYFIATLNANGITEEDIYDSRTLTAIKDMFGHPQDVDVTNLMNLVEKEFSVEFMQGGNLANPTLLKNQIMDYMEYRGPIVLAGGLLDKLNLFKGVDKVEDTVTCKSEYEQDLSDIAKTFKNEVELIEKYSTALNNSGITPGQKIFPDGSDKEKKLKDGYGMLVRYYCFIYYNDHAEPLELSNESDSSAGSISHSSLISFKKALKSLYSLKQDLNDSISADELVKSAESSSEDSIASTKLGTIAQKLYQYNFLMQEVNEFYKKYNALSSNEKQSLCDDFYGSGKTPSCTVGSKKIILDTSYPMVFEDEDGEEVKDDYYDDAESVVDEVYDSVRSYYNKIRSIEGQLVKAVNKRAGLDDQFFDEVNNAHKFSEQAYGDGLILDTGLIRIEKKIKELEKKKNSWNDSLDSLESGETKDSLSADYVATTTDIDTEGLQKLKEDMAKNIETLNKLYQFKDTKIFSGKDKQKLKSDIDSGVINVDLGWNSTTGTSVNYTTLALSYLSTFNSPIPYQNYYHMDEFINFCKDEDNIIRDYSGNKFLKYMISMSGKAQEEKKDKKKAEDRDKMLEQSQEEDASTADYPTGTFKNVADLPSGGGDAGQGKNEGKPQNKIDKNGDFTVDDSIDGAHGSIFSSIGDMLKGGLENMYLVEYASEMFSYRTINYDPETGEKMPDEEFNELMNLANQKYNSNSNMHRAELEYIIFGKQTAESNCRCAYAAIFGIRMLFNMIGAFTVSYVGSETRAIASAICGAVPFMIPLTSTVLKMGYALGETLYDMQLLTKGIAVPIIKNKDTWTFSLSGGFKVLAKELVNDAIKKTVDWGAKALSDNLEEFANSKAEDMKDKVDDIAKSIDQVADEILDNAENVVVAPLAELIHSEIQVQKICLGDSATRDEIVESITKAVKEKMPEFKKSIGVPDEQPSKENLYNYVLYNAWQLVDQNIESKIGSIYDKVQSKLYDDDVMRIMEDVIKEETQILSHLGGSLSCDDSIYQQKLGEIYDSFPTIVSSAKSKKNEIIKKSTDTVKKEIDDVKQEMVKNSTEYINEKAEKLKKKVTDATSRYIDKASSKIPSSIQDSHLTTSSSDKSVASSITCNYKEYLMILLLFRTISEEGEKKTLERIADLVQDNLRTNELTKDSCGGFLMKEAHTQLVMKAKVSGSTMLGSRFLKGSDGSYLVNYQGVMGY